MYKPEYLPAALRDMVEIVRYVNTVLQNPTAASQLAETFIQSIESIPAFPYGNPVHVPLRPLKHEYRKLLVHGNHLVFYWIDEPCKTVTVARVLYARSDCPTRLE